MNRMDIIEKIQKMIPEEGTVTGDIAQNTSGTKVNGGIATIGYKCQEGYKWDPKKRECVKEDIDESITAGAVVGSQQTRAVGQRDKYLTVLRRNPRPLKWNNLLGGYLPPVEDEEIDIPGETEEVEEAFSFSKASELKKYMDKISRSWHGLDVEWDKKNKEIHIFSGSVNITDAVYQWAKDRLPIKFKVSKDKGIVTVKV